MKRNGTMQDMIESILKLADLNQSNRKNNDVFRTNHTAAAAGGRAPHCCKLGGRLEFGHHQ